MKSKKNLFAAVLSLLLIFTFVPFTAFAAEAEEAASYPLEISTQADGYDIFISLNGGSLQPAGGTYYISAGTKVNIVWNGCFLHPSSDFSDGSELWDGQIEFNMPSQRVYLWFAHR